MSFLLMGFPPKNDANDRKSISGDTAEMTDGGGLVFGEGSAADFWPVQHPIEPPQGEKPVECPLPHSSIINDWRESQRIDRKEAERTSKRRHSVSHDGEHYSYRSFLFHHKSHCRKSFSTSSTSKNHFRHN